MNAFKGHPPPHQKMSEGSLPALLLVVSPDRAMRHDVGSISSSGTFHFCDHIKTVDIGTKSHSKHQPETVTFQINGQIQLEIAACVSGRSDPIRFGAASPLSLKRGPLKFRCRDAAWNSLKLPRTRAQHRNGESNNPDVGSI